MNIDESIAEYIASLHAQLRIAEEREMYFLTNQQNLQVRLCSAIL